VELNWRLSDEYAADDCVTIEMSLDGGKTWGVLARSRPAVGTYAWATPDPKGPDPQKGKRPGPVRFRLSGRDLAGNEARVESKELLYDDRPPLVRASGQPTTAGSEVTVAYAAKEGEGAGLESVRAYVSTDGGTTWSEVAVDADGATPLVWRAEQSGKYGMFLAGTDRAGNVAPAPAPGTDPQLTFDVRVGPKVKLLTFNTVDFYKGGSSKPVRWEAEGEGLAERCVTVEYSLDGGETWKEIAKDQPASCELAWTLPGADTEKTRLRVTAPNEAGDVGRAVSGRPFTIDSTPPRAVVSFDPSVEKDPAPPAVAEPPPMDIPEPPEPGPREPEQIARAREHLAARRYEQAIEALRPVLARDPGEVRANVLLGQAIARWTDRLDREGSLGTEGILRRYGRAAAALETAVRTDDACGEAHFWLGICHYQRARAFYERLRRARAASEWAARAVAEYERALSIEPDTPDEHCYAGMAYYLRAFSGPAKGRDLLLERARQLFEKCLGGIAPGSLGGAGRRGGRLRATAGRARWHLADLAARRDETPEALKHARAALELLGQDSDLTPGLRALIARLEGK
jgi:tetratricopeptide (TPR) repeat protein